MEGETVTEIAEKARQIAALATGLSPDQVERAVTEYRSAALELHNEPEWTAIMHMSGRDMALAQYRAEGTTGTKITMQIESARSRGAWEQVRVYVFDGKPFETYQEAREAELIDATKPKRTPEQMANVTELKMRE